MMRHVLLFAGLVGGMLGAPLAGHANLVVNGDFSVDDVSLGPVSPPSFWTATDDAGADNLLPFGGSGGNGFLGIGGLSQDLATVPGTLYRLSFELAADQTTIADPAASFAVSFGGMDVQGGVPIAGSDFVFANIYVPYSYQITALDPTSTLAFAAFTTGDAGTWYLDDVSVTPAGIPEPAATTALWVLGLLAARRLAMPGTQRCRR